MGSRLKFLARLVFFVWLATMAALGIAAAQTGLPTRLVPDTRNITHVDFHPDIVGVVDSVMQRPHETGLCLYGQVIDSVLLIAVMIEGVTVEADSASIQWQCRQSPYYVGVAHTHVLRRDASFPCYPGGLTATDFQPITRDDPDLIYVIFCADGMAYAQMLDGRWDWFRWQFPQEPPH